MARLQRGHARLLLAWLPLAQPAPVVWRARSGRRARSGSAPEQEGAGLVRVHHGAGGNEQRRLRVGRQRCAGARARTDEVVSAATTSLRPTKSVTWRQRGASGVEETVRVRPWFPTQPRRSEVRSKKGERTRRSRSRRQGRSSVGSWRGAPAALALAACTHARARHVTTLLLGTRASGTRAAAALARSPMYRTEMQARTEHPRPC